MPVSQKTVCSLLLILKMIYLSSHLKRPCSVLWPVINELPQRKLKRCRGSSHTYRKWQIHCSRQPQLRRLWRQLDFSSRPQPAGRLPLLQTLSKLFYWFSALKFILMSSKNFENIENFYGAGQVKYIEILRANWRLLLRVLRIDHLHN
jgi:hypothetical protein